MRQLLNGNARWANIALAFGISILTSSLTWAQDQPPANPGQGGWRQLGPQDQRPQEQADAPAPPPAFDPAQSAPPRPGPLVVPAGTLLTVRISQPLSSDHNQPGDGFTAVLQQPLVVDGLVVARRGQTVDGTVTESVKAGRSTRDSHLRVEIAQLTLVDGQQVPVKNESAGSQRKYVGMPGCGWLRRNRRCWSRSRRRSCGWLGSRSGRSGRWSIGRRWSAADAWSAHHHLSRDSADVSRCESGHHLDRAKRAGVYACNPSRLRGQQSAPPTPALDDVRWTWAGVSSSAALLFALLCGRLSVLLRCSLLRIRIWIRLWTRLLSLWPPPRLHRWWRLLPPLKDTVGQVRNLLHGII